MMADILNTRKHTDRLTRRIRYLEDALSQTERRLRHTAMIGMGCVLFTAVVLVFVFIDAIGVSI